MKACIDNNEEMGGQGGRKTTQPDLPAMPPDWTQPQIVKGADLAATIGKAAADGYKANTMIALKGFRYALKFERTPYATGNDEN